VRVVELSNQPMRIHQSVQEERAAAAARVRGEYEGELAEHRQRLETLRTERDQARAEHRWGRWLGRSIARWMAKQVAPRPPREQRGVSTEAAAATAGIEGELLVANRLSLALDDEWVLFRGYKNRRGEVDHLLVGPQGLIAIEGKHRSVTASCRGDEWWYDKYDRWGNHVEQDWLTDRGGRSPSQQLNEPTEALRAFLGSRGQRVAIRTAILLTHDRSRLGTIENPTVDLIATSAGAVVERLIRPFPFVLADREIREIERLITRDHHFHEAHGRRR
jgi:Nuclease-related domain